MLVLGLTPPFNSAQDPPGHQVVLHPSTNPIEQLLPKHTQRSVSYVILNNVKVTAGFKHHPRLGSWYVDGGDGSPAGRSPNHSFVSA